MARKKKEEIKTEERKKVKAPKAPSFYQAVGRRKEAVARVRLYPQGKGKILVNERPFEQYFPGEVTKIASLEPFRVTNTLERFDATVKVEGGGLSGQLGALIHGIARALEKVDPKTRPILKKGGFLTRDARAKERRKAGLAGKARKKKQSPKR